MARSTFDDFKVLGARSRAVLFPMPAHRLPLPFRQDWIGIIWSGLQGCAQGRSHGLRHEGDRPARDVKKGAEEEQAAPALTTSD